MDNAITQIVGEEAISALREPVLDDARGLPASVYTQENVFELERTALFPSTWASIAFDTDVPQTGDAEPIEFCGLPLILTRDKQ